ncbi:hypothetical protein FHS83_002262 [Rhizomicrobium palustre]|uniref:PET hydrolase/cutinase-like domain-containing protein n=1 Tax=Rhizomicrobium palustre TaxID=189966 RepID=A0A846MZ61_9PROT|nr:hypothetical protein [Rhizomicrobium palustre]NIK88944.1 hypothetical protein [Rhizomicrobium palustre]
MRVVQGHVERPEGTGGSFVGHRVLLTYRHAVDMAGAEPGAEDAAAQSDIVDVAGAPLNADGSFALSLPDESDLREGIEFAVLAPSGAVLERSSLALRQLNEPLTITCAPVQPFVVRPSDDPTLGQALRLTGRVIGPDGTPAPRGLAIVLWGLSGEAGANPAPLQTFQTQVGGYFSGPWPSGALVAAYAEVNGTNRAAITLEDGHLPRRTILVVPLPALPADDCNCAPVPPRAPDQQDLVANPSAYSQDLGPGCMNLTMPNRVLEEFPYFTIVRTTEPDVRPMNTDPPVRLPVHVRDRLLALTAETASFSTERAATTRSSGNAPALLGSLDAKRAKEMLARPETITAEGLRNAAIKSEAVDLRRMLDLLERRPARSELNGRYAIDWDLSPTVFEAVTVALGHVLHFRQTWRADGYSLGDLLYSLPLAPGQKRLVSMLDWTRRSTGSRTEYLESEEQMQALTERDRDISEIVNSNLDERIDGGSSTSTSAGGGGIGLGFIGAGFGVFGGVAGGASGSDSSSWQDSARALSGNSLQQIRDRTTQNASAVRNERSTVVQTVTQGETSRAETEVVANHNHCHALTIEYFEVLRHFRVSEELAYVSECIFVPLPMLPFDQPKVRRWRACLAELLRRPELAKGFDAIERIATNWDGWDYPEHRFSEEAPEELDGELRITFVIPRPHDGDDGAYQIDRWSWLSPLLWQAPFSVFNEMADHVNNLFRDINRQITAEFYTQIQRARDEYFAREVAPRVAEQIVHRMRFSYVTRAGIQVSLPLSASLISKYVDGVALYVSIRASGALPALPREEIARLRIYLAANIFGIGGVPPEARILVTSGRMRYRTAHITDLLFDQPRINNDLGEDDDVFVATPTTHRERRDPRAEDRRIADQLVAHLNEQLEYFHQGMWSGMDKQRLYMLLDGIIAPNSGGRSVASVVENRLLAIVGNCLVLPVTPGIHLDPTLAPDPETGIRPDLIHAYATEGPPPTRISVPTRGVYAEAIMGACNACEKKDDSRFWRWEESPLPDEPTAIDPISTASRQAPEPDATPTPLPQPIVNIQSAPSLPDALGLGQAMQILGRSDIFRDPSGLAGTQRNALAAFQGVMDTAKSFGGMAAKLAQQQEMGRNVDRTMDQIKQAQSTGMLNPQQAQSLAHSALQALIGDPGEANQNPVHDPDVGTAIEKATEAQSGSVTVTSPDETVKATFDGADTAASVGGTLAPEVLQLEPWVTVPLMTDRTTGSPPTYFKGLSISKAALLKTLSFQNRVVAGAFRFSSLAPALFDPDPKKGFLRENPAVPGDFQLRLRMRVVFPTAPGKPGKVAVNGRAPLVVLVHGNHWAWRVDTEHPTGPPFSNTLPDGTVVMSTPYDVDSLKTSESYAGYAYLQDYLAQQGIISVSVDQNFCNFYGSWIETRAQLVVEALDQLAKENANTKSPLFGKVDFGNVGLMGHSRGGDGVVGALKKVAAMPTPKSYTIKAVCSLSPTDFTGGVAPADRTFIDRTDTNFYFVMYGALDGDVSGIDGPAGIGGTGFRHYDRARCPKAMAFFKKCCHNSFNSVWHGDGLDTADGRTLDPDITKAPDKHQKLVIEYIGDLFLWQLQGKKLAGRFDGRTANSLGTEVSQQWMFGTTLKLFEDFENAAANLLGGAHAFLSPAPHTVSIRDENQVTHAGSGFDIHMPHQSHMLEMEWAPVPTRATGIKTMTSDVPAAHQDWSGLDTLIIGLSGWYKPDSDATIAAEWLPRVRIILTDTAGGSAVVDFNAYGNNVPSRPISTMKSVHTNTGAVTTVNATLMALETVPIKLSLFSGVDLHKIKQLALELEPAGIVTTIVDNIHVVKR